MNCTPQLTRIEIKLEFCFEACLDKECQHKNCLFMIQKGPFLTRPSIKVPRLQPSFSKRVARQIERDDNNDNH